MENETKKINDDSDSNNKKSNLNKIEDLKKMKKKDISKNIEIMDKNQRNNDKKLDYQLTTIEKQDISEDNQEQITSPRSNQNESHSDYEEPKKVHKKRYSSAKKPISEDFSLYLERVENYKKKKAFKLIEIKKELEEKEQSLIKGKPEICKKSKNLVEKKQFVKLKFLDRIKDEELKSKTKREKLVEKINTERAKKKEEMDKPLQFKMRPKGIDTKFQKTYEEMCKKVQDSKNKFSLFSEVVNQYEMRERKFQPNLTIDSDDNGDNKKDKKILNTSHVVERLYNNELKNRKEKKENLYKKYQLPFHPKISEKSNNLAKKWKKKMENKKEKVQEEKTNNNNTKNKINKKVKNKHFSDNTKKGNNNETKDNLNTKVNDNEKKIDKEIDKDKKID